MAKNSSKVIVNDFPRSFALAIFILKTCHFAASPKPFFFPKQPHPFTLPFVSRPVGTARVFPQSHLAIHHLVESCL